MAAGAIGSSGFNLATDLAPPERHGVFSGLVSVMLSTGDVVVTVAGALVLCHHHRGGRRWRGSGLPPRQTPVKRGRHARV